MNRRDIFLNDITKEWNNFDWSQLLKFFDIFAQFILCFFTLKISILPILLLFFNLFNFQK
jgi:hypothetical protein